MSGPPFLSKYNWASEASPTLGCSIEISRDIYIYVCRSVCLKETHTKNWYVKNAWAELRGPITRMLKVCFGRLKPNLKQTELQKSKNRGKKGWIRPKNNKTEKKRETAPSHSQRGDDNEFERNLRLEKVVSRKVLKLAGDRRRQKSKIG